jgi:cell division protein FtsQ
MSENYSARVLLVFGTKNDAEVKELLPLISFILDDDFLRKEIVGIEKLKNDEYQFSVRSGNYKIDFGKLAKVDLKFKKLKAFYNTVFEDKTIQNYKKINVKYHNQVVCTK